MKPSKPIALTIARAAAGLVIALGVGPTAAGQEMRKYGEVDTATVSAVDTDSGRLSIVTSAGRETFVVEPRTRIARGSEPIALGAVRIGDRVVVEARDEPGDAGRRLVADRILIVVDESATPGSDGLD